jgi:hypothetical protein
VRRRGPRCMRGVGAKVQSTACGKYWRSQRKSAPFRLRNQGVRRILSTRAAQHESVSQTGAAGRRSQRGST